MAIAQAERRHARLKARHERDKWNIDQNETRIQLRVKRESIKRAKQNQREDWLLGPLAPRRDVGDFKETYGTIDRLTFDNPKPRREELSRRLARFAGKTKKGEKYCNISKGDRVVLLAGWDKGKIGKVKDVNEDKAEVIVEGLNRVDVQVPEWYRKSGEQTKPVMTIEKGVSFDDVRLVIAIYDPVQQETRDVIVKDVESYNFYTDTATRETSCQRRIANTNIEIPWPELPKELPIQHRCDTTSRNAAAKTFVPSLLRPPMPPAVIDELRNKYSKFRTRHTKEYIMHKEAKEKRKKAMENVQMRMFRTPLMQKNMEERKALKKEGKGPPSEDMLYAIGWWIAKNKGIVTDDIRKDNGNDTTTARITGRTGGARSDESVTYG